jgi:hypothetical protein
MTRATALRAALLTLLGALLVGTVSVLAALQDYPTYQATLQMRIEPDPVVGAEVARSEVDQETFLASELVVLNGPEIRNSLSGQLPDEVDVAVRTDQIGSTSVVVVSATAPTEAQAREGADAIAARYAGRRKQDLLRRIASVQAEVDRQLAATSGAIDAIAEQTGVTSDIQRSALAAEYSRLIELQRNLQLAADASRRLVTVVKPTEIGGVEQLISPARNGVLGALAGAGLGLGAALGLSRWRRRVTGLDDLLELAPDVSLPSLPQLHGRERTTRAGAAAAAHVSSLTPPGGAFGEPAVVVVAPRPGAGATFTAVALAVASARRRPTVLLAAGDALDGGAADLLGLGAAAVGDEPAGTPLPTRHQGLSYVAAVKGTGPAALADLEARIADGLLASIARPGVSVVVDAPALSHSAAGLDLARESGAAVLVGGVERTRAAELDAAAAAVRRVGASLTGVVLSNPPRRLLRRRRG